MNKRLILKALIGLSVLSLIGCSNIKKSDKLSIDTSGLNGVIEVDYIDVGQGDAALIQVSGKSMLIDVGTNAAEEKVVKFIKDEGIEKIDYVIGTHPHEDHIGGLDKVIDNFEIGEVIMPKAQHTSKTFKSVLISADKKGLKIKKATPGMKIDLGENVAVDVLSPNKEEYKDLNNYSPVIKITYGEKSFLFTGDAEKEVEKEVINKGYKLKADVLKVGHHGSTSSTTEEFLKEVDPEIAIISVGKGNTYGHPEKEILNRLEKNNIKVLRTDEIGSIEIISNGVDLSVSE